MMFLFILFLGSFLTSCGCLTAKSKTPPHETIFLPTYRYRAWVQTTPTAHVRELVCVLEVRIVPWD